MNEELQALKNLVDKLEECQPHIDYAFIATHSDEDPYDGPTYGEELEAAKEILKKHNL